MDGQTENLFASDGKMMEFELWERLQKLIIVLLESIKIIVLKSKRPDNENAWTNQDIMELFLNFLSRRNSE